MKAAKLVLIGYINFIILLFNSSIGHSQFDTQASGVSPKRFNFERQKDNMFSLSLKNDYLQLLAFTSGMALVIRGIDGEFDEEYALEDHKFPFGMFKSYGEIGNLYDRKETYITMAGLSLAAVGYGLLYEKQKPVQTVKLMIKSWAITSLITSAIKISIGRHRPHLNYGPKKFDLFKFSTNASKMSFPSGHTASIFALMTVLAKQYDQPWVKISAYGFATSVAFQRMLYRKHWASDVIVGGLIGYLAGRKVIIEHNERMQRYSFQPFFADDKLGMTFYF
jgi:hypothetical protein